MRVLIPGEPRPKKRPRFGKGNAYKVDGPAEKAVAWAVAQVFGNYRIQGDVSVEAYFYRSTRIGVDLDNLLKLCLDACNGVAWKDDRQVKSITAKLDYHKEHPCTVLVIEEIKA